ncbi:hypothetical protein HK100_009600 [Physocladia obscura]|uniref:YdbS-like PH domain-containing protein n=1 Tax=Physocladia obscura TaxID=109957 RepID=A0AAD5T4W1_9FUNG|nr:hypothetical protein HK100_009600 [Physocladia obscura]
MLTKNQSCVIDDHRIHFKRGWLNKEDKLIPLDRVQDVNVKQGLLSRILGVYHLDIQTAGAGGAGAEATLIAVKDFEATRRIIISKRDALVHGGVGGGGVDTTIRNVPSSTNQMQIDITALKDSVLRIEQILKSEIGKRGTA